MKVRIRYPEWLHTFSNRQARFFEGELDPATGLIAVEREGEYGSTQPVKEPYYVHIGSGAVMQPLEQVRPAAGPKSLDGQGVKAAVAEAKAEARRPAPKAPPAAPKAS